MPWTARDAKQHKKDLTDEEAEIWAEIANNARESCMSKRHDEKRCDAYSIRVANAAINEQRQKVTVVDVTPNAPHGEGGTLAVGVEGYRCQCPECGHEIQSDIPCSERTCPQCDSQMQEVEEKQKIGRLAIYKSGNVWRWLSVSNVAVEDKEGEIVSEKAYDDAIAAAYADNAFGELDLVHVDGTDVGSCDLMVRLDKQLIEGGEWYTDERSRRVRERVMATPSRWGVSIKFRFDPEQFKEKVYQGGIRILKRSILPRRMAASYGTAIAVVGGRSMGKIDEETKAALRELSLSDEEIEALVEKQKSSLTEEHVKEKEGIASSKWPEDEGMDEKAVWETASVNDLPDSAFLFIEEGGEKDEEGKTKPRNLRHLPYRNANGDIDLPHLRNAIARLEQPATGKDWKGFSEEKRQALLKRARALLAKATGKEEEDEGKSLKASSASASFLEGLKEAVLSQLFGKKDKQEPESLRSAADAEREAVSKATTEVKSETQAVQKEEKAAEEENEILKSLKAYGAVLAQAIAETVAKEIASLKLELEKAEARQSETEKRLAELSKPIEQQVFARLNELPPIVKTRVTHLEATAKEPIAPLPPSNLTPQTYAEKMFADIVQEVAKKRGQMASDQKVKI